MFEKRDGHECWRCGKVFALVYKVVAGEGLEAAPTNCPECGSLNHLPVARTAALGRAYWTQKVEPEEGQGTS